ncbi:hypothetical protein NEIELOOT_02358 [Neisseria elongata subsp. glycolytica ATCC 29315]|uniref:Uncharacterized protein n=1 Tax=Neisseria elongata subsp. glycolytica ATCC 29315 TaxID=546263 RepID=D4DTF4_NEIEG|nr:hypothetical protein NEIELOOT_02358 [Neisseria elongata subsp. glycolytica ATCC 29315]
MPASWRRTTAGSGCGGSGGYVNPVWCAGRTVPAVPARLMRRRRAVRAGIPCPVPPTGRNAPSILLLIPLDRQ